MKPIIIDEFKGISNSPYTGFDVVANCDINEDGAIKPNLKYHIMNLPNLNTTFTADETTDIITHANLLDSNTGLYGNDARAVTFTTTGTLPTGLSLNTTYWLVRQTDTTSKLASTWQNAVSSPPVTINFTTNGTGTHTMTSVNMGYIKQFAEYSGYKFAVDNEGKVWISGSNSWGWEYVTRHFYLGQNYPLSGCVVYKNYLLMFGERYVGALGNLSSPGGPGSWTIIHDFMDMATGVTNHQPQTNRAVIIGAGTGNIKSVVYYANNKYIGELYENVNQTFNPSNSGTYTRTNNAFELKDQPTCLAEYSDDLAIGTTGGIYIWDKTSENVALPALQGKYISSVVVGNNILYALAGESQNETLGLYATNGTVANLLVEIPDRIATAGYGQANGIMAIKDKIFFLLSGTYTIYNSNKYNGLWSYNIKNGKLLLENLPTNGLYDTLVNTIYGVNSQTSRPLLFSSGTQIGSITYKNEFYQLYDGFEPYFITALYPLGIDVNEQTIMFTDFIFDRPLANADEIKVSYRKSSQGNFTDTTTFGFTTLGAKTAVEHPMGGITTNIIQLKVALKTPNSGGNQTSGPTIRNLIIRTE